MTQIINWNFLPAGFNPTYQMQTASTFVNAPIWTSTVTQGADLFQSSQQTILLNK